MKSLLSPQALEKELARLLLEASSGRPRAMSATVVVLDPRPQENQNSESTLSNLIIGRRPIRLIHALPFSDEERIWADTRCSLDRQSRGVCIEDIVIATCKEEALDDALWSPFLIRDLPALAYWKGGEEGLVEELTRISGRVDFCLFDGEDLDGTKESKLALMQKLWEKNIAFGDLAWERLQSLRIQVARIAKEEGEITSLSFNISAPWAEALFKHWLLERAKRAEINLSIEIDKELPPYSCKIQEKNGEHFIHTEPVEKGLIFTRFIDRPAEDTIYRKAVENMSNGNI